MLATRPGIFAASSERVGETNSPVATIESDDEAVVVASDVVVAVELTLCTSAGNAAVVVVGTGSCFFAQATASARVIAIKERFIISSTPMFLSSVRW